MRKILLSMVALFIAGAAFAQVSLTFNRTSTNEATVNVAKDGENVANIAASVTFSGATTYKEGNDLNDLPTVLCINRNTNEARENDPNKYTLKITNNSDNPIQFSKVVLKNGAFNMSGNWQGLNVINSIRKFKIGYNNKDGEVKDKYVCHNSNVNSGTYTGIYRCNSFDAPETQIINKGETYTLTISVYTEQGAAGMFYGLTEVSLIEPYSLEVGESGYATLMLGYNAQIPEDVICYKAHVDGTRAVLTEIDNNVAGGLDANTPVLVKADEIKKYVFLPYEDGDRKINLNTEINTNEGNQLLGTLSAKEIAPADGTVCYVLAQPDGEDVAFYRAALNDNKFVNNANKAYLPVADVANARFISFDFDTETAIDELKAENGRVNAAVYDLAGRRVQDAQKGIFIVNGKKVIK